MSAYIVNWGTNHSELRVVFVLSPESILYFSDKTKFKDFGNLAFWIKILGIWCKNQDNNLTLEEKNQVLYEKHLQFCNCPGMKLLSEQMNYRSSEDC